MIVTIFDRMQSLILFCTFFQAICLSAADEKLSYGQDGEIIYILLKKISDLEERDREFDRKLQEIGVLKERLDDAQSRLADMQDLEHRMRKAEERLRALVNVVDNNNTNCAVKQLAAMKHFESNGTRDIISPDSDWIRRAVSNIESGQAEMRDKIAELVSFKNRIHTAQNMAATKDVRRTVTRKAAFAATFTSHPITITPGHPVRFDSVDYNEGNAYDSNTGIFTCPVSGTYFFFTNILSVPNSEIIQTELTVDIAGKVRTYAFKEVHESQGSTAAALHCDVGQRVWVKVTMGSKAGGYNYSSFTGILLWPSDSATNNN